MVLGLVGGLLTGCGGSDDATGAISPKEAATQLDEAFVASGDESTTDEVHLSVRTAAEALREGNYEKAVVALEVTRQAPSLTLEQGLAVHNSLVSLEQNLMNAAAAGDANARRAYELLRKAKRN